MSWSSDRKEKRVPKRMEAAKRIWANPVSSMGLPSPGWEPLNKQKPPGARTHVSSIPGDLLSYYCACASVSRE
jgi:hypothetical protein